jgi:hypothetical protein
MPTRPPESSSLPGWARVLDGLCVLLAAVAMVVAMSGGFRVRIGALRIGITTPYPLLIWALVISIGRHLSAPQNPVYRELPHRLLRWWREPAVRAAARVVVATRPVIFFVGYVAVFLFGYPGGRPPLRHFNNELLDLPIRWDAGWYLEIVTNGYHFDADLPDLQHNIVFFPAYPMMVRVVGRLLGGHMPGYVLAGTTISLAAFWGALGYLYAFARRELGDEKAAWALWLLAAYPFAVFFGAIYTESLFLLAVVGSFYHFTKQQFGAAAFWGLVVGLTRVNGALLAIPLSILAISAWLPAAVVGPVRTRAGWNPRLPHDRKTLIKALAAAAMPVVGLSIYVAAIWRITGDPLAWVKGHAAWGRTYGGLTALVMQQYAMLAGGGLSGYIGAPGYDALNVLGALFAVATVWPVARRIGLAYAMFMLANILPALSAGGLLSAGRFSSVLFPAFVWLADAIPAPHRAGWIASFAALQAFNAALHYTWRPLF